VRLVEWKLPWISEHAAAIALAGFRSFTRAPEAKMALLGPIILIVVFGSALVAQKWTPPLMLRPLFGFGASAFMMLTALQLISNQFGYDRAGFRTYVLSPASRRDILLGKNLAIAPFVFGMIGVSLVALECIRPMRIDHFLAAFPQAVAMYLLFCLPANLVSIISPLPIAAGAMQPSQVKFTQVLAHLVMMFLFPVFLAPLLLPFGIETLVCEVTGIEALPIALPLTLVLLVGSVFIYRFGMVHLGRFLAHREQRVLEVVTSKLE
jgi:ABC-2 type transport system permease protein